MIRLSARVRSVILFMHFWKSHDAKLLYYSGLLFSYLDPRNLLLQYLLSIMIIFSAEGTIDTHKSSSSKAQMLVNSCSGEEAALQPLKCQRKPFTPPLVLLQGLLIRERVFLELYVAKWGLYHQFSGTDIPTYCQAVLASDWETQTARFLKSKWLTIREAWSAVPLRWSNSPDTPALQQLTALMS